MQTWVSRCGQISRNTQCILSLFNESHILYSQLQRLKRVPFLLTFNSRNYRLLYLGVNGLLKSMGEIEWLASIYKWKKLVLFMENYLVVIWFMNFTLLLNWDSSWKCGWPHLTQHFIWPFNLLALWLREDSTLWWKHSAVDQWKSPFWYTVATSPLLC